MHFRYTTSCFGSLRSSVSTVLPTAAAQFLDLLFSELVLKPAIELLSPLKLGLTDLDDRSWFQYPGGTEDGSRENQHVDSLHARAVERPTGRSLGAIGDAHDVNTTECLLAP